MKSLFQYERMPNRWAGAAIVVLLIALIFLVASCVPVTDSPILSPKLGAAIAKLDQGDQFKAEPTPTPVLVKSLKPEQLMAGVPADVAGVKGNAQNGPAWP